MRKWIHAPLDAKRCQEQFARRPTGCSAQMVLDTPILAPIGWRRAGPIRGYLHRTSRGGPIGLQLRACGEHRPQFATTIDLACGPREHRRPMAHPSCPHTGRWYEHAGLLADRIRATFNNRPYFS